MDGPALVRDDLRRGWNEYADRIALSTASGSITYARLGDRVTRLARALWKLGVGPTDAVGYVVSGDAEIQVEVRLATYEIGAPLFALAPNLLSDGRRVLRGIDPRVVIYDPRQVPGIPEWLGHVCPSAIALPARSRDGDYGGLLDAAPPEPIESAIDLDGLAAVGFTSGTTGPPKGITASHRSVGWSCMMMRSILGGMKATLEGGVLIGIPLFAAGGGLLVPALSAGATVHSPTVFDPYEALALMDRGEVISAFLTPSMVIDLLDIPDLERFDLSRVENIIYGTSIMPTPKLEEAIRRIGAVFVGGYGMAEVLPPVTVLGKAEHGTRSTPADEETLSSCGRPVDGVSVRVVDDSGHPVKVGTVGDVEVRSPAMTRGYWGDVTRTRESVRDGWWRSGDVGRIDPNGRLHILSRKPDLLFFDGAPAFPRHIEEACARHPAVKEACSVQHAADMPAVIAVSVRSSHRSTTDRARVAAEIREIVHHQLRDPLPIGDIMVFDEIPRSVQGKVLHREVRGAISAEGGIGAA